MSPDPTPGVHPLIDSAFTKTKAVDPLNSPVMVEHESDRDFPPVVLPMSQGKVTRETLAYDLCRVGDVSLDIAKMQVKAVIARISDALLNGHDVELRGLGSFKIKASEPRVRLDPRTKKPIGTWPHTAVRFKVSGTLDDKLNQGTRDLGKAVAPLGGSVVALGPNAATPSEQHYGEGVLDALQNRLTAAMVPPPPPCPFPAARTT